MAFSAVVAEGRDKLSRWEQMGTRGREERKLTMVLVEIRPEDGSTSVGIERTIEEVFGVTQGKVIL
jgi:hypothetical protein